MNHIHRVHHYPALRWIPLVLLTFLFTTSHSVLQAETAATVPSGFVDELVTAANFPTDMAFTPDGRMLIAEQYGKLRVYQNGSLLTTPALDLANFNGKKVVCTGYERGLLGITIDPSFVTNHYIYLFYTFDDHYEIGATEPNCRVGAPSPENPVNRVSRFTLLDTNLIDPASEFVVITNIINNFGNHNAGGIHFGTDGNLYIGTGDGGQYSMNTQDLSNLNGKILRVKPDGTYPDDNPHVGKANVKRCGNPAGLPSAPRVCGEVFASGLRNAFRFAFKPGTDLLYVNDIGQRAFDEIDLVEGGEDFGWSQWEGPCVSSFAPQKCGPQNDVANFALPFHSYHRNSGCSSITGGAFVPEGLWPNPYNGSYLYGDYVCGKIFRLAQVTPYMIAESGTYSHTQQGINFVDGLGVSSIVGMIFGPYQLTQALYYVNYNADSSGEIRRVRYTGSANLPPVAQFSASPTTGNPPLQVNFDASNSSDPDNDPITYDWDFDDGTTSNGNNDPTIQHTYTTSGTYTAKLIVKDNQGNTSNQVTKKISVGNTPPVPQINIPGVNDLFAVGQTIQLNGAATDAEDGTLTSNRLSWRVLQHHIDSSDPTKAHSHPYLPPTVGNNISLVAPNMEDIYAEGSYLEIELKAIDSLGATTVITHLWRPKLVEITLASQPSGIVLALSIENSPLTRNSLTPSTYTSWEQAPLFLAAPPQAGVEGQTYQFVNWSDNGAISHTITMPSVDTTFTASYTLVGGPTPTGTLTPVATIATPSATTTATQIALPTHSSTPGGTSATSTPVSSPGTSPTPTQQSGGTATSIATPTPKFSAYLPLVRR